MISDLILFKIKTNIECLIFGMIKNRKEEASRDFYFQNWKQRKSLKRGTVFYIVEESTTL